MHICTHPIIEELCRRVAPLLLRQLESHFLMILSHSLHTNSRIVLCGTKLFIMCKLVYGCIINFCPQIMRNKVLFQRVQLLRIYVVVCWLHFRLKVRITLKVGDVNCILGNLTVTHYPTLCDILIYLN